jgi:hypothetical protein
VRMEESQHGDRCITLMRAVFDDEGMMLKNGENILIRDNEDDFAKAVLQIYD